MQPDLAQQPLLPVSSPRDESSDASPPPSPPPPPPPPRTEPSLLDSVRSVRTVLGVAGLTGREWAAGLVLPGAIVLYLYVGYLVILAPGRVYAALMGPDWVALRRELRAFALLLVGATVLRVARGALRDGAANLLRARLGRAVHAAYLADGAGPLRVALAPAVDNADQRAAGDVAGFADAALAAAAGGADASGGLLEALLSVAWYSAQTGARAGPRAVAAAFAWSALAGAGAAHALRRAAGARASAEAADADLRFAHARVRAGAEEVAFARAHGAERVALDALLRGAVGARWGVVRADAALAGVKHAFAYCVSLVMYAALALAIAGGAPASDGRAFTALDAGARAEWIAQTGGVFMQLLYSLSMLVAAAAPLSRLAAHAARLAGLLAAIGPPPPRPLPLPPPAHPAKPGVPPPPPPPLPHPPALELHALAARLPGGRVTRAVSLRVARGGAVLIAGPSGAGKTSLLRAVRGLARAAGGAVAVPPGTEFLPQRARVAHGTRSLRAAVLYPAPDDGARADAVRAALEAVGWPRADAPDAVADWAAALSPGEMQRVAVAGVIARRPPFAVLDEPTSALDEDAERRCFAALRDAGVALLTVAHSPAAHALHDCVVHM